MHPTCRKRESMDHTVKIKSDPRLQARSITLFIEGGNQTRAHEVISRTYLAF